MRSMNGKAAEVSFYLLHTSYSCSITTVRITEKHRSEPGNPLSIGGTALTLLLQSKQNDIDAQSRRILAHIAATLQRVAALQGTAHIQR